VQFLLQPRALLGAKGGNVRGGGGSSHCSNTGSELPQDYLVRIMHPSSHNFKIGAGASRQLRLPSFVLWNEITDLWDSVIVRKYCKSSVPSIKSAKSHVAFQTLKPALEIKFVLRLG